MDYDSEDEEVAINVCRIDVSVMDLLNFGGPNMMKNGDAVWKAGHILMCGITSVGTSTCIIEAKCLQTSHPTDPPHSINLTTALEFKDWKFICSCKAGLGSRCKHIYAVLLHIHMQRKLDILTCTDMPQKWGKLGKEAGGQVLEPQLIREPDEFRDYPIKKYTASEEESVMFLQRLLTDPMSSLTIFTERSAAQGISKSLNNLSLSVDADSEVVNSQDGNLDGYNLNLNSNIEESPNYGRNKELVMFLRDLVVSTNFNLKIFLFDGLSEILLRFYNERICLSNHQALKINIQTQNQNNHVWRYERQLRITASECYSLYTAFKNKGDFRTKVRSYYKPKPDTKNMKIGRTQEPNGMQVYKDHVKCPILKLGLIIQPTCPWIGCSPDGYCIETQTVVEIKTLINDANDEFEVALKKVKYLRYSNGMFYLREKHKHYAQVQLNMFLLQSKVAHLVVYNYKSNEIKIVIVDFAPDFVRELINVLQHVYFNHFLQYIFDNFLTDVEKNKYVDGD